VSHPLPPKIRGNGKDKEMKNAEYKIKEVGGREGREELALIDQAKINVSC